MIIGKHEAIWEAHALRPYRNPITGQPFPPRADGTIRETTRLWQRTMAYYGREMYPVTMAGTFHLCDGKASVIRFDDPLMPYPQSLGEVCLGMMADALLADTMGTEKPTVTIHSRVEYPLDPFLIFSGKVSISELRDFRRAMYHRRTA
jgi:hypothetical protein